MFIDFVAVYDRDVYYIVGSDGSMSLNDLEFVYFNSVSRTFEI